MSQEKTMSSLIREVMLPAAAAVGFLVAMAKPSAQAQEVATAPEPAAVLVRHPAL
jgi:hypothetical protein